MPSDTAITVIGNLTAEPEFRITHAGDALATFTIAATPRILDQTTGRWRDGDTLFLRCTAWRQLAEHVADSLHRGARVWVQGSLKQRSYETRDGDKRTTIGLDIDEIGPSLRFGTATIHRAVPGADGDRTSEDTATNDPSPAADSSLA